nr:immunoglobulin light chain junction region [Macaca mulatta]
CQHGYGILYSF